MECTPEEKQYYIETLSKLYLEYDLPNAKIEIQ